MLIDSPVISMIAKVATSEIGMVMIGIIEALSECRKNMMIRMTSAMASRIVVNTDLTDCSMNCVES